MNTLALAALATRDTPLDPNEVKPGWVALLIVVILIVATYFLLRSFVKHSKKASQPWEGESTPEKRDDPSL